MLINQKDMVSSIRIGAYTNRDFHENIILEVINEYAAEQITEGKAARRLGMAAICYVAKCDWDTAQKLVPLDALNAIGDWLWEQAKEDYGLEKSSYNWGDDDF